MASRNRRRRDWKQLFARKPPNWGVLGLGYVGLPLIRTFIAAGFPTLGFDVDAEKIRRLKAGESYIEHIPSEWIARYVSEGKFAPTADMSRLAEADALLICVPTPLNRSRDPDLIYVEATAREIAAHLRPGQLVVLESTTYPGTTRDVVLPILQETGLTLGKDFFLAYSPEREDPGNPDFAAGNIPKVVGGADPVSQSLAVALYRHGMPAVIPVSSCEVAEACKIVENTYRAVNIAMVNELKVLFDRMGIDVWEVIDAAKTKPFGFQAFYPGPGTGRALHSHRSVLPYVARPLSRPDDAVHRVGRRDQHGHAAIRGGPVDGGDEYAGQAALREQNLRAGRGL